MKAYIAVGSNIDPETNILSAFRLLKERVHITGVSTFYQTEPITGPATASGDPPNQASYWNGVWEIDTGLDPATLKHDILRPIETRLGRKHEQDKFAPRTIDLDLVYVEGIVSDVPGLRLPHPEIRERAFVARPLLELAPDLVLPDTGESLASLPILSQRTPMEPLEKFSRNMRQLIVD